MASRPIRFFLLSVLVPLVLLLASAPSVSAGEGDEGAGWYAPPAEFESLVYVIVTGRDLVDAWKPFAEWKCRKGIPADVVAMEDILANSLYRGNDPAETLRNFLIDLYWKWGLNWVLLAGDVNLVPTRMVETRENQFQASDLYFAALDGSWNTDHDAKFGENMDRTDLVEELFVGRVPVETEAETEAFLTKFENYVKPPPARRDYQTRALLVGAVLGSDATWDADDHYREIKEEAFEPAGFEITDLEESEFLRGELEEWRGEEETKESAYLFGKPNERTGPSDLEHFLEAMNRGTGVVSHIIHSNVYLMGLGEGWITREHVLKLENVERPAVIFSSGCQVNMFNMESISEHMVLYPKGGAVAFIGCTVNTYAYQNKFERDFWEALFFHDIHRIGRTRAASKARRNYKTNNVSSDPITIINRGLNLLGDPEMSIWTKTPAEISLEAPETATLGETEIQVVARSGGKPLQGAQVCVWKPGEFHAAAETGPDGAATLPLCVRFPGTVLLTASAHNHVPFEGEIAASGEEGSTSVSLVDLAVADGAEGVLDAGEKASVPLAVWNAGDTPASGLTARVKEVKGKVKVLEGEARFPRVPAGSAAVSGKPLVLQAEDDAPPGHRAVLEIEMSDGSKTWRERLPLFVNASWVVRLGQFVDDEASDGDGRITIEDGGKTVDLYFEYGNFGSGTARDATAFLEVKCRDVTVGNAACALGDIPVGARIRQKTPFRLELSRSFEGASLECRLSLTSKSGPKRAEAFFLEEPLPPPGVPDAEERVDSVLLTWEPVDNERIAGYNVYRAGQGDDAFARVNPTLLTASCFEDTGLDPISEYKYRVTALDRSLNESRPSEPVSTRTIYGQQRDWPKETHGRCGNVVVADLDRDGDMEIGTGDDMGPWIWHHCGREVHHGGDFWTFGLFVRLGRVAPPCFADLDGDGTLEVIAVTAGHGRTQMRIVNGNMQIIRGGKVNAKVHVYDLDGKELDGWPKDGKKPASAPPQASDLDGDGKAEVFLATEDGQLHAWRADGSDAGLDAKLDKGAKAPAALVDLDGDGDLEIALLDGDGKLAVFHHDGSPVASLSLDAETGKGGSAVVAGDLDGDGTPELVFCGAEGKKVFALKADGTAPAGFPASIDAGKGVLHPVLADLDADGRPEIVVAGGTKVHAIRPTGNAVAGFPVSLPWPARGAAVGDVDGDGEAEVVVGTTKALCGFDADGKPLPGWPLIAPELRKRAVRTPPVIGDVDLDGDVEILAGAADKVMIWDLPAQHDPGRLEWSGVQAGPGGEGVWTPAAARAPAPTVSGRDAPALAWTPVETAAGYHVFRGEAGGTMGRITARPVETPAFSDADATGGCVFRYAVATVAPSGRTGPLSPSVTWEDPAPKELMDRGEKALAGGDRDTARDAFGRLCRNYPRSRFYDHARRAMNKIGGATGSVLGEEVRRYIVLGDAWASSGNKAKARACYRSAIEKEPGGPAAEEARGRLGRLGD